MKIGNSTNHRDSSAYQKSFPPPRCQQRPRRRRKSMNSWWWLRSRLWQWVWQDASRLHFDVDVQTQTGHSTATFIFFKPFISIYTDPSTVCQLTPFTTFNTINTSSAENSCEGFAQEALWPGGWSTPSFGGEICVNWSDESRWATIPCCSPALAFTVYRFNRFWRKELLRTANNNIVFTQLA